jgi:Transposase DDE domain
MYAYSIVCILFIIEKNVPHPNRPSAKTTPRRKKLPSPSAGPPQLLRTRFSARQLLHRFHQLLPLSLLEGWLALADPTFYWRAFTPLITLWYLVFQRLCDNHHLSHVQEDALAGGADRLSPRGKRLSQQLHSEATTSFSDARQRLPLEVCQRALWHTATQSAEALRVPKKFGLKLGFMDGSTCRLRPFGDIPQHFPAHRPGNCKKPPYWCLARVVGILCWATGIVLDNAMASPKTSEQALSAQLLSQRSWQGWLLGADRNFGVYSVARALVAAHAQALLRLTEVRARKLARSAGVKLKTGLDVAIHWVPTRHDQCPEALTPTSVAGRLLAVGIAPAGFRTFTLYLFTTLRDPLQYPASELVQIYGQRWNIELCFRYIKTQMDLGFLECHSAQMVRKEWLAGLIAYNLIRWTMGVAAALAAVPVHYLSFSRARELLVGWCWRTSLGPRSSRSWKRLLTRIAKARLPKRRKCRLSEPRAIRWFQKDVAKLEGSRAEARQKLAQANAKS